MSDVIPLAIGSQTPILVTWSAGSYAAGIIELDGSAAVEVPFVISVVLFEPSYLPQWTAYAQRSVRPGQQVQATLVGMMQSGTANGGRLAIMDVVGPRGHSLSVDAIRAGWGIPNAAAWEDTTTARDSYLHALQVARQGQMGVWGDAAHRDGALALLSPDIELATRPQARFVDTWAGVGLVLLVAYVAYGAMTHYAERLDPVRAAERERQAQRQAQRGTLGRMLFGGLHLGRRWVIGPMVAMLPSWRRPVAAPAAPPSGAAAPDAGAEPESSVAPPAAASEPQDPSSSPTARTAP